MMRLVRGVPWARVGFIVALVGAATLVTLTVRGQEVPWSALVANFVLLLSVVGLGIWLQGGGLFARPILGVAGPSVAGKIALTFDDGPDAIETRRVLALLESRGHRGTFFVIGQRAEAEPALVAELCQRGHGLGNHSFAHAHASPFWSVPRLVADLQRAATVLAAAAGLAPRWYRAPIGIVSPPVARAAKELGLVLVGWTATARDGVAGTAVASAHRRLRRALRPGAILVLHDGGRAPIAAEVLRLLLDDLDSQKLRSVTLDELLGASA